ncbi:MAG: HAD hydrolase-like protein [Marinosulfonomonas sp.]
MSSIFFDLDGTLTDPKLGISLSVIHALRGMNLPSPEPDDLDWVIGPSLLDSFGKLNVPDPTQALALYRERYASVGLYENSVYSGIPVALASLKSAGHRLFVATAKPHVYAQKITAKFDLAQYFDAEYGPELDGTRNDKGELLQYALATQNIDARDAIMVGDRLLDFKAAQFVGMRSVGVTWGYGDMAELKQADRQCARREDLPAVISTELAAVQG